MTWFWVLGVLYQNENIVPCVHLLIQLLYFILHCLFNIVMHKQQQANEKMLDLFGSVFCYLD